MRRAAVEKAESDLSQKQTSVRRRGLVRFTAESGHSERRMTLSARRREEKRVVHTGLPEFGRPTEHAVMADGHLRTTAVPLKMDGTFETGDTRSQIALALENLEKTTVNVTTDVSTFAGRSPHRAARSF